MYQCVCPELGGFSQRVAVDCVQHGHWFYVTGTIPTGKDRLAVDERLLDKYGVGVSKWVRYRRKKKGLGNVHYVRHRDFFVMLASRGEHRWFEEEDWPTDELRKRRGPRIRDVRKKPLVHCGYSISYKHSSGSQRGHVSVRIHPDEYRALKAYFESIACHRSVEKLRWEFSHLPFEPYARIRRQYRHILDAANRARRRAGFEPVPADCLPRKRVIFRPFEAYPSLRREAA